MPSYTLGGWGRAPYKGINTTVHKGPIRGWASFPASGTLSGAWAGGGLGSTWQSEAKKQKEIAFESLKSGEERFGKDPTYGKVEKYLADLITSQTPRTEAEKQLAIKDATEAYGQAAQKQIGYGQRAIGKHLEGAGAQSAGAMADWKAQVSAQRTKELNKAISSIQKESLRDDRLAREGAARQATSLMGARYQSADPFTKQIAKARLSQDYPNV